MIHIPHLETDVTLACQLSCVACNHHVALHRAVKTKQTTPEQISKDLNGLSKIMHAGMWAAIGGEPLLHRQLVDILQIARESKIADRLEVWTNGLFIQKQSQEFWQSFDILVLSIYPGMISEEDILWIRSKCSDEGKDLVIERRPHFRALLELEPSGQERTIQKFKNCFFRSYSRVANEGYFFTCCCAPHMPVLIQGSSFGTDGVEIEGLTEDALLSYLQRSEPLSICSICAGGDHTAASIPWKEERDPVRWLVASRGRA